MATRKKPKKLTKEPAMRFVASDPKDEPQAEGVNRFTSDERSFEEVLSSMARNAKPDPKSPWMKLQEALDLATEAEGEIFLEPLTQTEELVALRCRRYLRTARVELAAASEALEWVNQYRDRRLDEIRRPQPRIDPLALATDKDD